MSAGELALESLRSIRDRSERLTLILFLLLLPPSPAAFVGAQLDVLKSANIFITHGGANSMMESICAKVPMVVMPFFADQFDNGRLVTRERIGVHYERPVADASASRILEDVSSLLEAREAMGARMEAIQGTIDRAGGAPVAVSAIERYVAAFDGHDK